jgi:hypothetical protein
MKCVNDLGQIGGFVLILWFPHQLKQTAMIYCTEILLKVTTKHPQNNLTYINQNIFLLYIKSCDQVTQQTKTPGLSIT